MLRRSNPPGSRATPRAHSRVRHPPPGRSSGSVSVIQRIRYDFPGWDVYMLQADFDRWLADAPDRTPKDYEAAFYGFVRQHQARNHG